MVKILLILSGGTICCVKREHILSSDTAQAERALVANFRASASPWAGAEFDSRFPLDALSENMTIPRWNLLLEDLRACEPEAYDGVILAHGTDTLAYTASLLSLALAGWSKPLLLVAANRELSDPRGNGNVNFRAAVELIAERRLPGGVFAVFRNSDGVTWLHEGCCLQQSGSYSPDFFSRSMLPVQEARPELWPAPAARPRELWPLTKMQPLSAQVLHITPYVGLDYSRFRLEGLRAVCHGSYHSGTACTDRKTRDQAYSSASLLWLADRCRELELPLFIGPCNAGAAADKYDTVVDFCQAGAIPVWGLSDETLYVKVLLACALYEDREAVIDFVKNQRLGREFRD